MIGLAREELARVFETLQRDEKPDVYLAGPIIHADDYGNGWRADFEDEFGFYLNPVHPLDEEPDEWFENPFEYADEIIEKDLEAIDDADVLLVRFDEALSSAGTGFEWAYAFGSYRWQGRRDEGARTPVVVWHPDLAREDVSPWLHALSNAHTDSIYSAALACLSCANDGT